MDKELEDFLDDYYNPKKTAEEVATPNKIFSLADEQAAFCRRLALARAFYPMTQRQLAEKLGTTQSAIARLERGKGNPSLQLLLRVCDQLQLNLGLEQQSKRGTIRVI